MTAEASERRTTEAGEFGVFVFLVSEGLLFTALVLAYVVARLAPNADFAAGSSELSLPLGTINTGVLLTSSFCAALATIWGESGRDRGARWMLLATAALGIVFLCIKGTEYFEEAQKGLLPFHDMSDRYPKTDVAPHRLFFDVYLALTGAHALHVISGVSLVSGIGLFWRRLTRPAHTMKMAVLYWHFIDVIWVFLFPLLYLVR